LGANRPLHTSHAPCRQLGSWRQILRDARSALHHSEELVVVVFGGSWALQPHSPRRRLAEFELLYAWGLRWICSTPVRPMPGKSPLIFLVNNNPAIVALRASASSSGTPFSPNDIQLWSDLDPDLLGLTVAQVSITTLGQPEGTECNPSLRHSELPPPYTSTTLDSSYEFPSCLMSRHPWSLGESTRSHLPGQLCRLPSRVQEPAKGIPVNFGPSPPHCGLWQRPDHRPEGSPRGFQGRGRLYVAVSALSNTDLVSKMSWPRHPPPGHYRAAARPPTRAKCFDQPLGFPRL